jgi:3-oxoadipate enol-lactonase
VTLHYRLDGPAEAPALVLASSLGTTMDLWESQVPALAQHFRVVCYDHPGHGGSGVGTGPARIQALGAGVIGLLDELEIGRASFCGLSIGGAVAMQLALAAPARVERLVLACTSARFGEPDYWQERARTVREQGVAAISDTVVERWLTAESARRSPELVARFRDSLEATEREGYARCCEALGSWDVRGRLAAIGAPTIVIAGDSDVVTPIVHAELLAHGIGAPLVVLERAAHLANVERPDEFNRAVLDHLRAGVSA